MPNQEKEIQFYSAAVNAWFGTRLEHDRSLLTLSAGGVGLLLTLLSAVGVRSTVGVMLYITAILLLLVCLACVLLIFKRNSTHLQEIVKSNVEGDAVLRALDTAAIISFFLGVLVSSIIGVSTAIQSLQQYEASMSGEQKTHHAQANDSFNGAASMRPGQADLKKSFEGAASLRPAPATPPVAQPATAPSVPAVPQSQQNNSGTK